MSNQQTLTKKFTLISSAVLTVLLLIVFTLIYSFVSAKIVTLKDNEEHLLHETSIREADALQESYNSKGDLLSNLTSEITAMSLMTFDMYTLNTIASQLITDDDVVKVQFVNEQGDTIVTAQVEDSEELSDSLLIFTRDIKTDPAKLGIDKSVGTLVLTIDTYRLIDQQNVFAANETERVALAKKERSSDRNLTIIVFIIMTIVVNLLIAITINIILKKVAIIPILKGIDLVTAVAEKGDISIDVARQFTDVVKTKEIDKLAEAMEKLVSAEHNIVELTTAMANGNWMNSPELRSDKDALNSSLQNMINNVNQTLLSVQDMASQVTIVSQQLSDSGQALATGANDQASGIESINIGVNALSELTSESETKASDALIYAEKVNKNAVVGNSQMVELNEAMGDIKESSTQIQKIIKTIDDIAFQTNLLALNAAVEAARAGQHGKGFAVVADEVRNLATRSAKAAQETAVLVEESNSKVQNGLSLADQTGESLKDIVDGVSKINESLAEIASSASTQVSDISGIKGTLGTIDHITQQNAATAEETASMAVELSSQAVSLTEQLAQFDLIDAENENSYIENDTTSYTEQQQISY